MKEKATSAEIRNLTSRIAALEQLLEVYENNVLEQTDKLYREIGERKRTEEELERKNLILSTQQEASIDGILVVDENNAIISFNRRFVEIWGIPPEMAEAGDDAPVLRFVTSMTADPDAFLDRVRYLYEHRVEKSRDEISLRDGRVLDRYSAPMLGDDGSYFGRVWYLRDISERKRAEEKLHKFSLAVEQSPVTIVITDTEGTIEYVNPAFTRITQYTSEEAVGKNPRILKSGLTASEVYADLWRTITSGREWRGEWCDKKKNGELFWESAKISPITDATGAITNFMAIKEDITDRKRIEEHIRRLNQDLELKVEERTRQLLEAQEELVRTEKLSILGQLSGSVGHELRNPLGVMNNAVYFLKMVHADGDETTKEYLEIIKNEIDTSLRIITDLLDFARTREPQTKTVTPRQLLAESLVKCVIPENVELLVDLPDNLPLLMIDPLQMVQVFQNLFINAIQAMPEGGGLHISARLVGAGLVPARILEGQPQGSPLHETGDFLEISVADTGEGISPENMKKLFQPLFTTKAKGIGLGLVVCKNLVEANGGKIEVESEWGVGSTFKVILKVVQ